MARQVITRVLTATAATAALATTAINAAIAAVVTGNGYPAQAVNVSLSEIANIVTISVLVQYEAVPA